MAPFAQIRRDTSTRKFSPKKRTGSSSFNRSSNNSSSSSNYNSINGNKSRKDSSQGNGSYNSYNRSRPNYNSTSGNRKSYNSLDEGRARNNSSQENRPNYNSSNKSRPIRNSSGGDRPRYNSSNEGRPRFNSAQGNKSNYSNSQGSRPSFNSSQEGKPRYNSSQGNKPRYNSPQGNRPRYNSTQRNRPRFNSSYGNRPRFSGRRSGRPKTKIIDKALYTNDLQSEVKDESKIFVGKKFTDFGFGDRISQNLKIKGYETTTEVQEKTIPMIMEGKDVLGISETGSGKTGAFLIPMVQKLLDNKSQKLLVVAPTRELAQQISREALSFVRGTELQIALIIGGENMRRQVSQLRRGGHIIVGTPGRINDLIRQGELKADQYNNIVVDEVDRMLDMGFIKDIQFIISKIAQTRQALFFSATLNNTVEKIVASLSKSYELVKLSGNTPIKSVVQSVIDYNQTSEKFDLLEEILNREEVTKAIIFVDTKRFADKVDKILYRSKFKVGVIHGDKRQNVRKRVIESFKNSRINVLVATNVAARGIDINDISHVINLDEPQTYDEYIHRIGRTGRNGSLGTAYTFVGRER